MCDVLSLIENSKPRLKAIFEVYKMGSVEISVELALAIEESNSKLVLMPGPSGIIAGTMHAADVPGNARWHFHTHYNLQKGVKICPPSPCDMRTFAVLVKNSGGKALNSHLFLVGDPSGLWGVKLEKELIDSSEKKSRAKLRKFDSVRRKMFKNKNEKKVDVEKFKEECRKLGISIYYSSW